MADKVRGVVDVIFLIDATGSMGKYIEPVSVSSSPFNALNSVDFPQPFAPTKPTFCPSDICAKACSKRTLEPMRSVMSFISIIMGKLIA